MDTNQPIVQTTYTATPSNPGIFGTKIPSSVAFVVGILLFLMPFSELKCGGTTIANISGLNIALKKEWKAAGGLGSKELGDMSSKKSTSDKGNSWIFAMAALGLGILGLLLSLTDAKAGLSAALAFGVLAAGALIGMMLQLKNEMNASIAKQAMEKSSEGTDTLGFDKLDNYKPVLSFTPWFYIAVIAFLVAAFFCYKRMAVPKTR